MDDDHGTPASPPPIHHHPPAAERGVLAPPMSRPPATPTAFPGTTAVVSQETAYRFRDDDNDDDEFASVWVSAERALEATLRAEEAMATTTTTQQQQQQQQQRHPPVRAFHDNPYATAAKRSKRSSPHTSALAAAVGSPKDPASVRGRSAIPTFAAPGSLPRANPPCRTSPSRRHSGPPIPGFRSVPTDDPSTPECHSGPASTIAALPLPPTEPTRTPFRAQPPAATNPYRKRSPAQREPTPPPPAPEEPGAGSDPDCEFLFCVPPARQRAAPDPPTATVVLEEHDNDEKAPALPVPPPPAPKALPPSLTQMVESEAVDLRVSEEERRLRKSMVTMRTHVERFAREELRALGRGVPRNLYNAIDALPHSVSLKAAMHRLRELGNHAAHKHDVPLPPRAVCFAAVEEYRRLKARLPPR